MSGGGGPVSTGASGVVLADALGDGLWPPEADGAEEEPGDVAESPWLQAPSRPSKNRHARMIAIFLITIPFH